MSKLMILSTKRIFAVVPLIILEACVSPVSPEAQSWNERLDAARSRWEPRLGERVTIEGDASNCKLGAQVGDLWVADFRSWPAEANGKGVRVTGKLIFRDDLPVFPSAKYRHGEIVPAGIGVPEGVDLEKARRRYLLEKVEWSQRDP